MLQFPCTMLSRTIDFGLIAPLCLAAIILGALERTSCALPKDMAISFGAVNLFLMALTNAYDDDTAATAFALWYLFSIIMGSFTAVEASYHMTIAILENKQQ